MENVYIVAYGRSAVAKAGKKGHFRDLHPVDLGGPVLRGVLERVPQLQAADIDDIVLGCATPERAQGMNLGRLVSANAGIPDSVPAMTLTRFCSSGLQAIDVAAMEIESGQAEIVVAGGVESMTSQPMTIDITPFMSKWILENHPDHYMPMGITAENVAAKYGLSREEMEAMAVESHARAAAAQEDGKFDEEIIPIMGADEEGKPMMVGSDQCIRKGSSMESLAALKPAFREDGIVTAATSSQTSDGASFVVLMSGKKVEELGIKPIAKFIGFAVAGCEPRYMGLGPIYAVPKVMELTGLTVDDMDVIELNEAFASQAIACMKTLEMDPAKVNPNGGAMALGHPLGATGAVLTCKALSELKRTGGKYALVTMCIGGGQGAAGVYEML